MNEGYFDSSASARERTPSLRFPFAALLLWGTGLGILNLLLGLAMQRLLIHFSGTKASNQTHITMLLGVFTLSLVLALLPSFLAGVFVTARTNTHILRFASIAGVWCSLVATLLSLPLIRQGMSWADIMALLVIQLLSGLLAGSIGGKYRLWQGRQVQKLPSETVSVEEMDVARLAALPQKNQSSLMIRWWKSWQSWWARPDVRTALAVTLALRLFCSLAALLAAHTTPGPYVLIGEVFLRPLQALAHTPPPFTAIGWINYLSGGWRKWDTAWYTGIAAAGYTTFGMTAFLPLYPALINVIGYTVLGKNLTAAGLLISTVFCFYAFLFIYRLAERLSAVPGTARRLVFLTAVLPVSFFLVAGYTEALFLWATFGAMLAFCDRQWARMALFAAIASLTRHQGLLLSLLLIPTVWGICQSWWLEHRSIGKALRELRGPLLAALAGPVVYFGWACIIVWVLHQPLPWVALKEWNLRYSLPGTGIFADLIALVHPGRPSALGLPGDALDAGLALLSAAAIILAIRRIPPAFIIFAVGIWLLALFKVEPDGETMSTARYLLPLLPVAVVVAERLVRSRPSTQLILLTLGSLTVFFCTWYFILGLWVN